MSIMKDEDMPRYAKVYSNIWRSRRFCELSDEDRSAFFYLLTCEHQTSTGVARIPPQYGATDLHRTEDQFSASLGRLVAADLISVDTDTCEVFVRQWTRFNGASNRSHLQGIINGLEDVESDTLRRMAREEIDQFARPASDEVDREAPKRRQPQPRPAKIYGEVRDPDF